MAVQFTFYNMAQLISALTPVLIAFFLLMLTCMNQNFKGLIFIAGAILALFFNIPIMNTIQSKSSPDASAACSLIDIPILSAYNSPSNSSLFIAFTIAYLCIPMTYSNQINYPVVISLLCLFAVDAITRVSNNCTTMSGSFLGALIGFTLGSLWFGILQTTGAGGLLYFNEMDSNSIRCERPTKQKFKCSVFKNGVLLSSNIA